MVNTSYNAGSPGEPAALTSTEQAIFLRCSARYPIKKSQRAGARTAHDRQPSSGDISEAWRGFTRRARCEVQRSALIELRFFEAICGIEPRKVGTRRNAE